MKFRSTDFKGLLKFHELRTEGSHAQVLQTFNSIAFVIVVKGLIGRVRLYLRSTDLKGLLKFHKLRTEGSHAQVP